MNEQNLELTYQIVDFCDRTSSTCWTWRSAGCWQKPSVASVIAGAVKTEQIDANIKAAEAKLSAADLAELDKITVGALASQPH